jgi:tetratricopeptide (TPR) repeat protein
MTTFQKLKHEARRAEQRSDWARAIDLYQQALDTDEDMADLSLYNRIGDLYLRLGKNEAAVECYERAVERYADHGMHTSAIALCNKILRIAPGRTSVYRQLGGLHARTGLVVEGRSNILAYARQALEQGKSLDAARAVDEFAELTGDEDVRFAFADNLEAAGDAAAAAEQLRAVYRLRQTRGEDTVDLRARIEALAPDAGDGHLESADTGNGRTDAVGPVRLARLVAGRLAEDEEGGAFEPDAPVRDAEPDAPHDERLDGVRHELERFRSGVQDVLEGGDLTVRYDLGVELMTIGLLDEAIEEFQFAVADPGLVEAANARIGECLALRTSGSAFDVVRRVPVAAPGSRPRPAGQDSPIGAEPEPTETMAEEPASPAAADAEPEEIAASEFAAESVPEEGATADAPPGDDELQGHFFRARLAQYRIRRAEERHSVDHAAHLDLGTSYVGMELFQEALRELSVALEGPRPVSGRAARTLQSLALDAKMPADLALQVLERLAVSDHARGAETLGARLAEAWGEDHAMAGRLNDLRGHLSDAVEALPALEEMFPGMSTRTDGEAEPAPESGEAAASVSEAAEEEGVLEIAETEDLEELNEMLAELEAPPTEAGPKPPTTVEEALAAADELAGAGDVDAAIESLHVTFGRLGESGRTREALTVLDRLIELEPDEEVLHHQRTELAEMVNDRERLLRAWSELGACLRRKGDDRRARAAYGRMLDIDPEHEKARQVIGVIDADELERERTAAAQHPARPARAVSAVSDEDAEELEALLDELEGDDEIGEAVAIADDALRPTGAATQEAASGTGEEDDVMARSRYELGLAFRQMGMWEEAVRELRPALDGVDDRLQALEALGECLVKSGHADEAVDLLRSNLRADEDAEQIGPLYFLGLALQVEGDAEGARDVFARVKAVRPGYRDAADRLSELSL